VAPRGDVVDSDDQPIVKERPIVVVGVEPPKPLGSLLTPETSFTGEAPR